MVVWCMTGNDVQCQAVWCCSMLHMHHCKAMHTCIPCIDGGDAKGYNEGSADDHNLDDYHTINGFDCSDYNNSVLYKYLVYQYYSERIKEVRGWVVLANVSI